MGYIAFVIVEDSRAKLLKKFPAKHSRVIAHHVTLKFGVTSDELEAVTASFGNPNCCTVTGHGDYEGVDCVSIRTGNHFEQDNGTKLHITLSCADGVKPVQAKHAAERVVEVSPMILTGKIEFCQ